MKSNDCHPWYSIRGPAFSVLSCLPAALIMLPWILQSSATSPRLKPSRLARRYVNCHGCGGLMDPANGGSAKALREFGCPMVQSAGLKSIGMKRMGSVGKNTRSNGFWINNNERQDES